ncbi:hypothetical protein ACWCRD_16095 [Streptomyces sp. NPDC002092]
MAGNNTPPAVSVNWVAFVAVTEAAPTADEALENVARRLVSFVTVEVAETSVNAPDAIDPRHGT